MNEKTERAKIMVVEDESIVALSIKRCLQNMGHEVAAVVSAGETAIMKAEQLKPSLVLMDIGLKGKMDGIEAAGKIISMYNIPVIFLTAHAEDAKRKRALSTGPAGYLLKPFNDNELRNTIARAIGRQKPPQD